MNVNTPAPRAVRAHRVGSPAIPDVQNRYFGVQEDTRTGKWLIKDLPDAAGDEKFYRRMIEVAKNSPTAQRATELLHSFIVADGFADRKFGESKANLFQTWDDLLFEMAYTWVYCGGICLNVFVDPFSGEIKRIDSMPFYRVVRTTGKTFLVNPRFKGEKGYKTGDDVEYFPYNPGDTAQDRASEYTRQIGEYKREIGYLFYAHIEKPLEEVYPIPAWFGVEYDMKLEYEYSKREYNQLRNGFKGEKLIETGPLDDTPITGANGEQTGPSEYEAFTSQIREATKPGSVGAIIHVERKTAGDGKEIGTKVIDLNPYQNADDLGTRQDNCAYRVARGFGAPPVMVGLMPAGGIGDTKQLADEIQLLNDRINKEQRFISSMIRKLLGDERLNTEITTHNPISYIPEAVLAKMSDDEIRALAGLEPLTSTLTEEKKNIISALNAMIPELRSKVLESLSEEEIRGLIGLGPKTQPAGTAPAQP